MQWQPYVYISYPDLFYIIPLHIAVLNTVLNTFVPRLEQTDKDAGKQVVNTFIGYGQTDFPRDNLSLQIQLGSTEYPQRPVRAIAKHITVCCVHWASGPARRTQSRRQGKTSIRTASA